MMKPRGTPLSIARGQLYDSSVVSSQGELTTTGAVTDHLIWPLEGSPNIPIPAGVQLTFTSTSANDTAAGTGIRSVRMIYLDGDLVERAEIVTMNGTGSVLTVTTDVRFVQALHLYSAGSGGKAAGNIRASHSGTVYSMIPTGKRRCSSSARRVPAGKRLIVVAAYGAAVSGAGLAGPNGAKAELRLVSTAIEDVDLTSLGLTFPLASFGAQDGAASLSGFAFAVPPGALLAFEATCDKEATISAGYIGWFEPID